MKKIFILLLVFALFISLPAYSQAKWTIMIYMAGDNGENEDLEGDGWVDLMEMKLAKVGKDINIIVERDFGSKGFDGRYKITGQNITKIKSYDEINLGDPKILTRFIKEVKRDYPAERYAIVFWGHGTGMISVAGPGTIASNNRRYRDISDYYYLNQYQLDKIIAQDAITRILPPRNYRSFAYDHTNNDSITLVEAKQALREAGVKFDLIAFDACIMNQVEVLYQLKDFADIITAAFTYFPGGGYWYTGWLKKLNIKPDMSTLKLAKYILASNKLYYTKEELFVPSFVETVRQRMLKNLRNRKNEVLEYMKENGISEDKFEEFINAYADNYIKENKSQIVAAAKRTLKSIVLNFGIIKTDTFNGYIKVFNKFVKTISNNKDLILDARQKATSYNPLFGEQYGNFHMDLMTFAEYIYSKGNNEEKQSAAEFMQAVKALEPLKINIGNVAELKNVRMGIFFPENIKLYNVFAKYYEPLDFAKDTQWDELLKTLISTK